MWFNWNQILKLITYLHSSYLKKFKVIKLGYMLLEKRKTNLMAASGYFKQNNVVVC